MPRSVAQESVERIREALRSRTRLVFFAGRRLEAWAKSYAESVDDQVLFAGDIEEARQKLHSATTAGEARTAKVMVVVDCGIDAKDLGPRLRELVAPFDRREAPDIRTVMVGEAIIRNFGLLVDILWSHVVDWLPEDLEDTVALERLQHAWFRKSLRIEILGLGLRTGAPQHVLAHQATRVKYLIEPLRLLGLPDEPLFQFSMRGVDGAQDDPFETEMLKQFERRWRAGRRSWEEAYGISGQDVALLKDVGLTGPHAHQLAPRLWAICLAEVLSDIAAITYKDCRELADFLQRAREDYFYRESDDG